MKTHWFFKVLLVFTAVFTIWTLFYYGLPKILPVQSIKNAPVYGLILSDQVWEGEVKVVGDIYSLTNNTVTILPGTKVKVAISGDKSNFDFLPWHRKGGVNTGEYSRGVRNGEPFWDAAQKIQINLNNLVIPGTFSSPVTISSDSDDPSQYDFNLIKIKSGYINEAVFSDYRRFEITGDAVISDSIFRNTGECALCLSRNRPQIYSNFFEENLRESIWIDRGSPEISNNLFQNLTGDGIRIDARRLAAPVITNNDFEMPQGTAIDFISGGQVREAVIARNIFSGNSRIMIACDANVRIRDNVILGQVSFTSGCDGGFVFGPNYWGTMDTATIKREKILNKHDVFSIDIPTPLMMAPRDAGRI